MPLATRIRLPRAHVATFPDRCCRCLAGAQELTFGVAHRLGSLWELVLPWLWLVRRPVRCRVPVCAACRPRVLGRRWLYRGAVGMAMVCAVLTIGPTAKAEAWARGVKQFVMLATTLVVGLPVWLLYALRPLDVDLTVGKEHVDYEFASAAYAHLFHAKNPEGTWQD